MNVTAASTFASSSEIPTIKSIEDIENFIKSEKEKYGIEFLKKKKYTSKCTGIRGRGRKNDDGTINLFVRRIDYQCNRNVKAVLKQDSTRSYKNGTKKLGLKGCPAKISFSQYEGVPEFEVKYTREHSHELFKHNLKFLRVSKEIKRQINLYFEKGLSLESVREMIRTKDGPITRDCLISDSMIRKIQMRHEKSKYQLDPNDMDKTVVFEWGFIVFLY